MRSGSVTRSISSVHRARRLTGRRDSDTLPIGKLASRESTKESDDDGDPRAEAQRDLRRIGQLNAASDVGPSRGRLGDRQRTRRTVRDDAPGDLEAHQGAGAGRVGYTGSTRPIPTLRNRRRPTPRGLDLGRAIPARLGGPLRPYGQLPHTTSRATEGRRNTMTDNNGS